MMTTGRLPALAGRWPTLTAAVSAAPDEMRPGAVRA